MKIIIAPAAFKHSLTSHQVATAIERGLQQSGLTMTAHVCPIADGGNGTLAAFSAQHIRVSKIQDPLGRLIEAEYGLINDGQTAVIEMALSSGLELVSDVPLKPLITTTYGTGQLMQHALDNGATRFIVGMGGSATVDGGAGCLQALGVRLLDQAGRDIPPGGGGLARLASIDVSGLDPRWSTTEMIIATDVDNPTLGEQGAVMVFGPQKGASSQDVLLLEQNLNHFFTLIYNQLGVDVRHVVGGGAAGAFSAGLMAFFNGTIQSGVALILDYTGIKKHIREADLVITGEGHIDTQTLQGKGPIGVARLARDYGVMTVAIVGGLNADERLLYEAGIDFVLPIVTRPMPLDEALDEAENLVERTALRLGYLLNRIEGTYAI